jgi:PAS domain S-box-containing protein
MAEGIQALKDITLEQEIKNELRSSMGEVTPDAIVIVDLEGTIWMVNAATVRFFRYSRDEMIGQKIEMLLPERFREKHLSYRKVAWRDQRDREMAGRTLIGLTKDGEEFPVDIQLAWREFRHGIFAMAVIRKPREGKTT